jgi:hypothetical protein
MFLGREAREYAASVARIAILAADVRETGVAVCLLACLCREWVEMREEESGRDGEAGKGRGGD